MNQRAVLTILLVPIALAASWWAWQLRPRPATEQTVGPLRSDYTVETYHLVVMNKDGEVSFRSTGPYAARDPDNHELFLNTPNFSFPDRGGGGDWTGHSYTGWVSAKGDEVRLKRDVVLDGPVIPDKDQAHMRTEQLAVFPDSQTAHSKLLVTATRGATILTGVGMNAWLKTNRFELLSKVSIHDVPAKKD
ncbi:MAG TPA: LPS export ABC transporter periplasmic protein LptC [Xanthomonadaceae bacterium]|jgi:lipopolysaccharide export system protein LptC